jgi:hypothetical protein
MSSNEPQNEMPLATAREELVAELAVLLLIVSVAREADQHDSPALSELACLLAALHAQVGVLGPGFIPRAWDFVEALRELHARRDGRHASLAGYLKSRGGSLVDLLAPTNLHVGPTARFRAIVSAHSRGPRFTDGGRGMNR